MSTMGVTRLEVQQLPKQSRAAPTPPVAHPRVCLLIGTLGLGGAEKQLALLARGLHARGVPTHVITLFRTGPREAFLREAGVPITNLSVPKLSASPRGAWRALRAAVSLARVLRRERPQVLHAFLYVAYVLAPVAALLARVPTLVAGRRSLGDYKDGHRLAIVAERLATTRTRLLVANAHAVARDTLIRERVPDNKLAVVYNGIAESAFAPAAAVELTGCAGPVVVCVANLKVYKGHRYLLQAAAALRDRGTPITTVLIGEGPERESLRRQAEHLALDVRLFGHRTDVASFLARADIAVLPSLTEGMSNAVMEAMAAGLPTVATDVGGTAELLTGRGILVPPGDSGALAGAIASLLARPEHAAGLGRDAREWARANLSEDAMVERYLEIYTELAQR